MNDPSSCLRPRLRQDLSSGDCNALHPGQRCVRVYEIGNACSFPVKVTECRLLTANLIKLVDEQGMLRSNVDVELGFGYLRNKRWPGLGPIGYISRLYTSLSLIPIGFDPVIYPNQVIPDKHGHTWVVEVGVYLRPEADKPLKGPIYIGWACRAVKAS